MGIISDTHGLLRTEALSALQGCELIVHAGDVGKQEILEQLQKLAPVIAVRGNTDGGIWASNLPLGATAKLGNATILVLHILEHLDLDPAVAGLNLVVSGHSHKPACTTKSGVIYLNPGSAGPRRFKLPITVARVHLTEPLWRITFIDLETGAIFQP